jgi:hypothetical protein
MINKLKLWYQIAMERTFRRVVREIKYRKRIREMRKKDPFIY